MVIFAFHQSGIRIKCGMPGQNVYCQSNFNVFFSFVWFKKELPIMKLYIISLRNKLS